MLKISKLIRRGPFGVVAYSNDGYAALGLRFKAKSWNRTLLLEFATDKGWTFDGKVKKLAYKNLEYGWWAVIWKLRVSWYRSFLCIPEPIGEII